MLYSFVKKIYGASTMNKKYITLALTAVLLTACGGGSSSSANDGKGDIDLKEYYPNESMTKTTSFVEKGVGTSSHIETIEVINNIIITSINSIENERVTFSDTNITTADLEDNETFSIYRHVDLGDTVYSKTYTDTQNNDLGKITTNFNAKCKLDSKENKFEKNDHIYEGDLLKIECINEGEIIYDVKEAILAAGAATDLNGSHDYYNKSYYYLKKDLGLVASIDDDCIPNTNLSDIIDDRKSGTECASTDYEYEFYLP